VGEVGFGGVGFGGAGVVAREDAAEEGHGAILRLGSILMGILSLVEAEVGRQTAGIK
jgi:hypothetical protein